MKVWIVEGNDYEDQGVRSVWTTEDAAINDLGRRLKESQYERITVTVYEVDPKDGES